MKTRFFLPLFFVVIGIYSQTVKVTYQGKVDISKYLEETSDAASQESIKQYFSNSFMYYLYYNNGDSVFFKDTQVDKETTIIDLEGADTIYKNQKEKEYLVGADLLGRSFLIVEKLEPVQWHLLNEKKVIGKFECTKASTTIEGEDIEAWYTSDIPIFDGPEDYWGLPGLIVELKKGNLVYTVTEIDYNTTYAIQKPSQGKVIGKKEFQKLKEEKLQEILQSDRED